MENETKKVVSFLIVSSIAAATIAVFYAAMTDNRWPLWFASMMLTFSFLIAIGEFGLKKK